MLAAVIRGVVRPLATFNHLRHRGEHEGQFAFSASCGKEGIVGFTDGVHFERDRGIGWNQIAGNGAQTEANGQRVGREAFAGLVAGILQDAIRIGGLGIGISNAAPKAAAIGGIGPILGERARSPPIAPTNGPQFQWPTGVHVRCSSGSKRGWVVDGVVVHHRVGAFVVHFEPQRFKRDLVGIDRSRNPEFREVKRQQELAVSVVEDGVNILSERRGQDAIARRRIEGIEPTVRLPLQGQKIRRLLPKTGPAVLPRC